MRYIDFTKIMRETRKNLGLTQAFVARQIPISPSKYCKIEKAKQEPSFCQLVRISQVLKLDLTELFEIKKPNCNHKPDYD